MRCNSFLIQSKTGIPYQKPYLPLYSPDDPQRGKHRAIVCYKPTMAHRSNEEEEVHEIVPVVKFTMGYKTKLDSVSPAHWVAANACILAEIVKKSLADTSLHQLTCHYMSYTSKIELACNTVELA